jgi:predicted permease
VPVMSRLKGLFDRPHLRLIALVGLIVPRRLRSDWRQEWEAELRHRELLLADWDLLDRRRRFELLRRSTGAFWDALVLQSVRLEGEMFQDLRFGLRMLLKNPGFTAVVMLTLAIGIGANAIVFSLINPVLIHPLPYKNADRLVVALMKNAAKGYDGGYSASPADLDDWRKQSRSFESLAGERWGFGGRFLMTGDGISPQDVYGGAVSSQFFPMLGVQLPLGRSFLPEDEVQQNVVILSYGLWQHVFNGNPDVIGRDININGYSRTVVGVLPKSFQFRRPMDIWIPLQDVTTPGSDDRALRVIHVFGLLKPGVGLQQAQAEMDTIADRLAAAYPVTNKGWGVNLSYLGDYYLNQNKAGQMLVLIFGIVGLVLLLCCANIANLMLARATARGKEIAVRTALGASRGRLVRQLIAESLLLSFAGGFLGVGAAYLGLPAIKLILPALPAFRSDPLEINAQVLVFSVLLSLASGLVFGIIPALQHSKIDLHSSLKDGGRYSTGQGRGGRTRNMLVVLEFAVALMVVIGAGLTVRSLINLRRIDSGLNPDHLLMMNLDVMPDKYPDENSISRFYGRISERLKSIPGVVSTGMNSTMPLARAWGNTPIYAEGAEPVSLGDRPDARFSHVSYDYFATSGTKLVAGRFFTPQEMDEKQRVIVINHKLAEAFWPGQDPVGRLMHADEDPAAPLEKVVGVAGDVKFAGLDAAPGYEVYYPCSRARWETRTLLVRTSVDPMSLATAIQREIRSIDPDQPVSGLRPVDALLSDSLAARKFSEMLLALFAGIALVLAAVGIYGVLSYAVSQRRHEMGIRMAVGAEAGDIIRLIVGQGMRLTLTGVVLGLVFAFAFTRLMASLLFGVSATDPITFAGVSVLLALVGALSCYVPARRAMKVDPVVVLRDE